MEEEKCTCRSPYDWSKVGSDTLNEHVAKVLHILKPWAKILIVSGRDGICREETRDWLHKHNIVDTDLFMRAAGDKRKDTVIKKEIFFRDIAPNYNVLGVFDDRNSVVKMWREIGLTCFQVAEGDF